MTNAKWVMARTSCIGTTSFHLLGTDFEYYNLSKSRIDFLSVSLSKRKRDVVPKLKMLSSLRRKDLLSPVLNHCYSFFDAKKAPEFLIIDSGSDLGDYKFSLKTDKTSFFYATFMDVSARESEFVEYDRMISLDKLEQNYRSFFRGFNQLYPGTPIFLIHYPIAFEKRKHLIERHIFLRKLVAQFSDEFQNLHTIIPPEKIVATRENGNDKSPYHFNKEVYEYVANEIKRETNLKGLI